MPTLRENVYIGISTRALPAGGEAHGEAENIRRLTPGEHDPHPRVRIRIP